MFKVEVPPKNHIFSLKCQIFSIKYDKWEEKTEIILKMSQIAVD